MPNSSSVRRDRAPRAPRILLGTVFTVLLAVAAPSTAQFTMPPGFLSKENVAASASSPYSVFFGAFPDGRMQIISGDWLGKPAVTMKSLFLRRDSEYYYTSVHGQARSWSNVKIQLADSDWTASSPTFAANFRGTPTTIFNGPTSWGDTTGQPSPGQPWGGQNISFGFLAPYVWQRFADLCFDFQFTGGKLANASTWSTANYVTLDGFSDVLSNGPIYNTLQTTACGPSMFGASILSNGQFHPQPNTMSLDVFQSGALPLTNHVGSIGVRGSTTGFEIGACNKLYLLHTPVLFPFQTSANGFWSQPRLFIPFNPIYVGLPVFTQAAFSHPITGAFTLTGAMRSLIPALPQWSGFRQLRVTASNSGATVGTLDSTFVPILRIN